MRQGLGGVLISGWTDKSVALYGFYFGVGYETRISAGHVGGEGMQES